jgi:hypothetical protein
MTICIAAACEGGKHIVIAVDRMFTAGHPLNVEFEPNVSKIERLFPGCVGLASGPTLYADEIYADVKRKMASTGAPPLVQLLAAVKDSYVIFRGTKVEEQVIQPMLGEDLRNFRARGVSLPAYLQPQAMTYQQVLVQASQFSLQLDLMAAGIDGAGYQIAVVTHPGTMLSLNKLGYGAIGSGAVHALIKLHLGGYDPGWSLRDTLYAVYDAKRAAEVAPGVGKKTEMAVVSAGDTWSCPDAMLTELESIHSAQASKPNVSLDKVGELYEQQRKGSGVH